MVWCDGDSDDDADHHGDDSDNVNRMMMVDSDLIPVVAPLHVTFVLCQLGCQQLGGSIDVDNLQFSILIDASYKILKVVKCSCNSRSLVTQFTSSHKD